MRISDHTHNRLIFLKAIRRFGPVARTDLPHLTGLSSGLISQLTGDLVKRGLLLEQKEANGQPGRPRVHVQINGKGAMVLGASLAGAGYVKADFVDLSGNRLSTQSMRLGPQPSLENMAIAIGRALKAMILASPFKKEDINRVGVALPALVHSGKGEVHFMTTFEAKEPIPFASIISDELALPVTIENDLTCMARAEHWFGRAQDLNSFTLVHLGFAVGSAEYFHGIPKAAANGLNPEFGHVKSVFGPDARSCICGGRGCLLSYASMYGILQASGNLEDAPFPPTKSLLQRFEQFIDRADAGDMDARRALNEAGTLLGTALANYITACDPGNLLIAISNDRFRAAISEPLHRALHAHTLPGVLAATNVEVVVTDDDWRWRGTAALALEQIFLSRY